MYFILAFQPSPKAGEVDARERRGKTKPGHSVLQVVVGYLRGERHERWTEGLWRRGFQHHEDRRWGRGTERVGHGGNVSGIPEVLARLVGWGESVGLVALAQHADD